MLLLDREFIEKSMVDKKINHQTMANHLKLSVHDFELMLKGKKEPAWDHVEQLAKNLDATPGQILETIHHINVTMNDTSNPNGQAGNLYQTHITNHHYTIVITDQNADVSELVEKLSKKGIVKRDDND